MKLILKICILFLYMNYLFLKNQIASELNAAILKMEHKESTSPRLNNLLKMILWAQDELEKKKVKYPKMTDLGSATIENPK